MPSHFHDRDQLVYASRGVMTVRTSAGTWVVPTQRTVWIPAAVPQTITMSGTVAMRTLYLTPRLTRTVPRNCCVVNVSPLLKELILHACTIGALKKTVRPQGHLIFMIIDQLETIQMIPLQLPNPSDPRALRVAAVLFADPSDRRPPDADLPRNGCEQEDGGEAIPGRCRHDVRQMATATSPHGGDAAFGGRSEVTHAAVESGYSPPSAFISMFRKTLGTTPTAYFRTESKGKQHLLRQMGGQASLSKPS